MYDLDMNKLKTVPIKSNESTLTIFQDFQIIEDSMQIVFVGTQVTSTDSFKLFLRTDYDLNVLDTTYLEDSNQTDNWIHYFFINENGNYVVKTWHTIAEYNAHGELLNGNFEFPFSGDCIILHNDEYLTFRGQAITYYNSSFDIQGNISPENDSIRRSVANPIKPKGKEYFYVAALVRTDLISANEALLKVYGKFNNEVIFIDTISPFNWMSAGERSFDLYSESHIYFGSTDQMCGFLQQSVYDPDSPDPCDSEYVTLNCVDSLGNVNWTKYLGGDGNYFAYDIVATPDSGCIYLVSHHNSELNQFNESDMYYIKFDKDGNVEEPVGISDNEQLNIPIYDIMVYPNPTSSYLYFQTSNHYSVLDIIIYDLNGRRILQESIYDKSLNIENLLPGSFSYQIFESENLIQSGKFQKY